MSETNNNQVKAESIQTNEIIIDVPQIDTSNYVQLNIVEMKIDGQTTSSNVITPSDIQGKDKVEINITANY